MDNFQFKLYTSFSGERDRIGLDLCDALEALCKKMEKPDLFSFEDREYNQPKKSSRWNEEFYQKILSDAGNTSAKKVWMCGTPIMQEVFDKESQKINLSSETKVVLL